MLCNLCPRQCAALRTDTEGGGFCRMPALPKVARAALHRWEEPPISGENGSGTLFFSGCSLNCVFCQNHEISQKDFGTVITPARLREICLELVDQGAHNINFVNPTHYAHVVAEVLKAPLPVPAVWNSGGYDRVETLKGLEGRVDIYLPDFKYVTPALSERYSGAADYPETAAAAIQEMYRQTGPYALENGLLTRGLVIRHLILPGRLDEAKAVMDWVADHFPENAVLFSLMRQYVPQGRAASYPELHRKLRASEARVAAEYMENLGLAGFIQGEDAADVSFIPPFDLTGVLNGCR